MLRRFSSIRREPVILRKLDQSMPEVLEDLFGELLADLERLTATEHQGAMKSLLLWLAFAERPLTMSECQFISRLDGKNDTFDLGEELQTRHLSALLKLANAEERFTEDGDDSEPILIPQSESISDDNPDSVYDDGNLPIKFQGRSMQEYFCHAPADAPDLLRTPPAVAHVRILVTCSRILCGDDVDDAPMSLKAYAAKTWVYHMSWALNLGFEANGTLRESDQIAFLEALGAIFMGQGKVAAIVESLGIEYGPILKRFENGTSGNTFLHFISKAAHAASSLGEAAPLHNSDWVHQALDNGQAALSALAKAHVTNWFQASDFKSALRSYRAVKSLAPVVSIDPPHHHHHHHHDAPSS